MKQLFSKIQAIAGILVIFIQQVSAQSSIPIQLPSVVPLSPEGASVAKYVDYPVDQSRGLVNITVPIYEIKTGDLTLPISLSYHASGIKPREGFGWVGTGWTLNAEPSIVRQVVGIPDERSGATTGYINNPNHNNLYQTNGINYERQLANGTAEELPDNFYYKLLSENGAFFVNSFYDNIYTQSAYHGIVTQPFRPLVINYLSGSSNSFNIRDENGVYYVFGGSGYQEFAGTSNDVVTRWLCNYVQGSSTNARIDFTYGGLSSVNTPNPPSDQVVVEDQVGSVVYMAAIHNGLVDRYIVTSDGETTSANMGSFEPASFSLSYTTIQERKIQQISFGQGRVEFSTSGNNLNKIKVYDALNALVREVTFFVTPYNNNTDLTKLDSIQIKGGDAAILTYRFEYESPYLVPDRLTNSIDHWGYYNGQPNTSLVPYTTVTSTLLNSNQEFTHTIGGANRESSFPAMQTGVLKSISSPEGTLTRFYYGINKYGYIVSPTNIPVRAMGGLRIEQIDVQDAGLSGTGYIHSFEYGEPISIELLTVNADWGIPKANVSGNDYAYSRNLIGINYLGPVTSRLRFYMSSPLRSIDYNNGSSVLYKVVTEKIMSKDNSTKDVIVKRRFRAPDQPTTVDNFPLDLPLTEITDQAFSTDQRGDFIYGQLLSEEIYRNDGAAGTSDNLFTLVQKKDYTWSLHKDAVDEYTHHCTQGVSGYSYPCVNGIIWHATAYDRNAVLSNVYYDPSDYEDYNYVGWSFVNGSMKMDSETTTTYDGGASFSVTKNYVYDDNSYHLQPTQITTTNSDNTVLTEYFSYPEDIALNMGTMQNPEDLGQDWLLQTNRITTLLESREEKGGISKTTRVKYDQSRPLMVKTKGAQATTFENRVRYHLYDGYGNTAETSQEGGSHMCYLWCYNNQFPVAKLENATYTQLLAVVSQTFIDDLRSKSQPSQQDLQTINNLRTLLPSAFITTYTYQPLVGMTSVTNPNGVSAYYEYDGLGRLLYIKDKDLNVVKKYAYHIGY